uniref:Glucan endo-1,3-beta-D-glucosidase n=1 Tax=Oryza barthii TaxID=65489 RepID=A0A0D3FJ20_9ORYZ
MHRAGTYVGANTIPSPENSPSEFAKIVQSKQTKHARVFIGGADHRSLRSLANTGEEVILTVPNDQLEHMAEFPEEAELWVAANVARFLPATRITHVVAGDDVVARSPGNAYFLLPAMANLHAALAAPYGGAGHRDGGASGARLAAAALAVLLLSVDLM